MVFATSLLPIMQSLQTLDAKIGIGKIKFALLALLTGPSIPIKYVCPLVTSVRVLIKMEPVLLATPDMT